MIKIKKCLITLFSVTAFFLFLPTINAGMDSSLQTVEQSGKLRVGFCAQYPPFESVNEKTGEFEGFDISLAKEIAKDIGVKPVLIDAEWQGLLAGLKKGDYDVLITCMSKSETRSQNINFSDVYYELPDVIVVRKDNKIIKTQKDLKNKTVGVQLGSGSEMLVDKMKNKFKSIKRYNYNPEAFTDLKTGRVDAVVVGYAYAVNHLKKDNSFKVVGEPLAKAEIVIVLPKGANALTSRVNKSLDRLKANGKYQEFIEKWLSVN